MDVTNWAAAKKRRNPGKVETPPIVEILTHYGADRVPERLHGWAAMRCPFHDDGSASGSVNVSEGLFKCHACGVKGDGITIVREREGLDFPSALETIAGILGRSLTGVRGPTAKRRARASLFEETGPVAGQTSIFQTGLR